MRELREATIESSAIVLQKKLVNVRILGHLLVIGLTDPAKTHIARTIIACQDDEALIEQGEFYDRYFIRACKPPTYSIHLLSQLF